MEVKGKKIQTIFSLNGGKGTSKMQLKVISQKIDSDILFKLEGEYVGNFE